MSLPAPPAGSAFRVTTTWEGTELSWPSGSALSTRLFLGLFLGAWMVGWAVGLGASLQRFGRIPLLSWEGLFLAVWVAFWLFGGLIVAGILLVIILPQKRERLFFDGARLGYAPGSTANPLGRRRRLKGVREQHRLGPRRDIAHTWRRDHAPEFRLERDGEGHQSLVAIQEGRQLVFGHHLREAERAWLHDRLRDWARGRL